MKRANIVALSIVATAIMIVPAGLVIASGRHGMDVPPASEQFIVNAGAGVPLVSFSYTPDDDGNWSAVLENHGLRSVKIVVLETSFSHKPIAAQFIDFESRGASPTGTVSSEPVRMLEGVKYIIIAKDPDGMSGTYAVLTNEWVSDQMPRWTTPVTVAADGWYNSLAMAVTENGIYLTSWEWPYGGVSAFSSADGGMTWASGSGLPISVQAGFSDICAYSVGPGQDVVLVVAGDGRVYKSADSGLTFSTLAVLPLGNAYRWSYVAIGTNASWTGAAADSDIYVIGGRYLNDYYGQLYLSITKSTDGGLTWSAPREICNFLSYYPKVTSDGTDMYVIFNNLDASSAGYASLYAMKSSDWGATWTNPTLIFTKTYADGGANPCTLEYIGDGEALVTISDHRPIYEDIRGTWAVLDLATLTLTVKGYVMGGSWQVDLGFVAHIMPDGRVAVGWLYRQPTGGMDDIKFVYGINLDI